MKICNYFLLGMALFFTGCAAINTAKTTPAVYTPTSAKIVPVEVLRSSGDSSAISVDTPISDIAVDIPGFKISTALFDTELPDAANEELKELFAKFNIPMTDTPRVQHYLGYFTGSGRDTMQKWLDRSNKYMYLVLDIFEREGVPLDLAVLAFTESGFNPHAYSRAGAAGMWQFMRSTGKMYDLNVTNWVDERRDFEKATVAAARHLNDLYKIFDDWYLSLAAYNAGSGRIQRATQKHKSQDFFTIANGRTLKLETRDYVPKYLAQLLIFKNLSDYEFAPPSDLPILFDKVEVPGHTNIIVMASALGCPVETMKSLNPELLTPVTPPGKGYMLRVPLGKKETAVAFLSDSKVDPTRYTIYKANAGETLARIALNHGVTVKDIQKLNSFPYDRVYTAKILFIPKLGNKFTDIDEIFAKNIATLAPKYYTVRKGDNMTIISKKHNMPLVALIRLNPKINPKRIYPGQVLMISQGGLAG